MTEQEMSGKRAEVAAAYEAEQAAKPWRQIAAEAQTEIARVLVTERCDSEARRTAARSLMYRGDASCTLGNIERMTSLDFQLAALVVAHPRLGLDWNLSLVVAVHGSDE